MNEKKSYNASIHGTFTLPENATEKCYGLKVYLVDVEGRRKWERESNPQLIIKNKILTYRKDLKTFGLVIALAPDYMNENSKPVIRVYERCIERGEWKLEKIGKSDSRSKNNMFLTYSKPSSDIVSEIRAEDAKIWRKALEMESMKYYYETFAEIDPITYKAFLTEKMLEAIRK